MRDDVSKEVLFAQKLEKICRTARDQGNCVSTEQVAAEFAELNLGSEKLQMVLDYLLERRIAIDEPGDPDSFLTDSEKNYLKDYLEGLAALPVCSRREREALVRAAMTGEKGARQRLTESFLPEVADMARLYAGQGVFVEDLVGEGNVALAAAVDGLRGTEEPSKVPGFLARQIMDAMEELVRECAANARMDKKAEERVNQVADKARELAGELRRKVTPEELSRETGMSLKTVQDALRMSGFKIEDIEYAEDDL